MNFLVKGSLWLFVFRLLMLFPAMGQDPRRFQSEIDRFREDTTDYTNRENLVLFTGSSSVRMWDGLAGDFPGVNTLNRGFGGSHMSDLLYYADTLILFCQPKLIFIYEGDNDVASGVPAAEIIQTARTLVERIRSALPETDICFISAKPSIARWSFKAEYLAVNALLRNFAATGNGLHYLDLWNPALDSSGSPRKDIFLKDSLHLNRAGYDIWRYHVGRFLDERGFRSIRFGVCTAPVNGRVLLESGFDYLEGGVSRDLLPGMPEPDFVKRRVEIDSCPLPVFACNGFLPGTMKLTGPDVRPDTVLGYAGEVFRRAKLLGIQTIVLGSGRSRSIPDGFDPGRARQQFIDLMRKVGPIARKYDVIVAIENLQRSESNFINTVEEALTIAREVNHPNIRILADLFHMSRELEGPAVLSEAGSYLVHCHIAEVRDRTAPGMAGDDFRPYFGVLKKSGYRGGISIEGSWKNENLREACRVLHEQWETAQ
jgi:sugar phosphate isomerase/epimerase/lysophospholipase L1-like esterase